MCLKYACNINVEKDIVCYKVYLKFYNNILLSPYRRSLAPEFNVVAKTNLGQVQEYWNTLSEGFHSYVDLYDAIDESLYWNMCNPIIVKCIIPKGSKCYIGRFSDKASYCSDSIKLVEQIEIILPELNLNKTYSKIKNT